MQPASVSFTHALNLHWFLITSRQIRRASEVENTGPRQERLGGTYWSVATRFPRFPSVLVTLGFHPTTAARVSACTSLSEIPRPSVGTSIRSLIQKTCTSSQVLGRYCKRCGITTR